MVVCSKKSKFEEKVAVQGCSFKNSWVKGNSEMGLELYSEMFLVIISTSKRAE